MRLGCRAPHRFGRTQQLKSPAGTMPSAVRVGPCTWATPGNGAWRGRSGIGVLVDCPGDFCVAMEPSRRQRVGGVLIWSIGRCRLDDFAPRQASSFRPHPGEGRSMTNLRDILETSVSDGTVPGAVALVARGDRVEVEAVGFVDVDGISPMA